MKAIIIAIALSLALLSTAALADVPSLMNYQGTLTGPGGVAVNDTVSMTFRIYDAESGGSVLWNETQTDVIVDAGLFNVLLGSVNPLTDDVFVDDSCWLGIQVGGDSELTPRQRIVTVGYAFRAAEADTSDYARSAPTAGDGDWTIVGSDMYSAVPGFVGIGVASPAAKLDVRGSNPDDGVLIQVGNSDASHRLQLFGGRQYDPNPYIGWKDGDPLRFSTDAGGWSEKVRFTSDGSVGIGTATPGARLHVEGGAIWVSGAGDSTGLWLASSSVVDKYDGVLRIRSGGGTVAFDGSDNVGIGTAAPAARLHVSGLAQFDPGSGSIHMSTPGGWPGIIAYATGGNRRDIIFDDTHMRLLCGSSSAAPGGAAGITIRGGGKVGVGTNNPLGEFHVYSDTMYAGIFTTNYASYTARPLYAAFTATGNHDAIAIEGVCKPADFYGLGGRFEGGYIGVQGGVYATYDDLYEGVYGFAAYGSGTNMGVHGTAGYGDYNYGVYGSCDGGGTANYAGYFSGDVAVTGNLSKGSGSFKIDHPLDPENKYLVHSFVESPDMMDVYNGNVVLDADGRATVQLPDWFETLNRDFRYQLTAIGQPGPDLYIAEEISGNSFRIAGGTPGMKVSWMITGIRQDPFANAHRIQVEVDKPEKERGKYLHPEAYGLSKERGLDYELLQKAEQKSATYEPQRRAER